ncbi:MAG: glutathionylspermidine synthase family protein [Chloroflexi bacterium]|nr:glutathionylspermidine synthase family protein [Chloroflexota bacterium]
MRALRDTCGPLDSDAEWESFLLEVVRRTPMPDFLLYGEPYPAMNGIVITRDEHRRLVELTQVFAVIFAKAVEALARDESALERMGFPWVAIELLGRETADAPFVLGRFDFMLDRGGSWQLLEYNADTPSGAREAIEVEQAIARRLGASLARSGGHLAACVRRAVGEALADASATRAGAGVAAGATLGLVTDAGYSEDLAQGVFLERLLAPTLAAQGISVVLGDIDNLRLRRGRLCLLGRPLDALYRYYPFETLLGQQAFVDLFTAVTAGTLRLLNGLRGLLAQNKGVLAWLWAHRDDAERFTAAERRAICDHLPPARWIGEVPPGEDPAPLVIKQVFGREGEEVYFGDRLAAADWERGRAWGSYIVQQRVEAEPLAAVVRTSRGPEVQHLWPAVGSFTARAEWAGYYTRLGGPITTGRAKYVATFYE